VNTFTDVWRKLSNKKYRTAFAKTQFKRLVPLQIQALRKQRGWSQEVLAENAKLTQGVISRAEDQDYGNLTVNTILNIAEGFDVAFVGRFVPFSELDRWYVNLSQATMHAPSFDAENAVILEDENKANIEAIAQEEGHPEAFKVDDRFRNVIGFGKAQRELEGKGQSTEHVLEHVPSNTQHGGGLAYEAVGNSSR